MINFLSLIYKLNMSFQKLLFFLYNIFNKNFMIILSNFLVN